MDKTFAGFIITYERATLLKQTIKQVFAQSIAPSRLLIVDNSETDKTQRLIEEMNDIRIEYLRVGYNAGPAGAANLGLQKLADEDFDWIYWGDDDDPPVYEDYFEKLLSVGNAVEKTGILGVVGHRFNTMTGNHIRTPDRILLEADFLEVDSIAGGQCMIVHSDVVKKGNLPESKLFFSFEDLDLCMKAKRDGFKLIVPTELFIRARKKYNRMNYQQPIYNQKEMTSLKRQYYSTRNILVILSSNGYYVAYFIQLIKGIAKAIYGFRFGWDYGRTNFRFILLAIYHSWMGKMGKQL